MRGSDIIIPKKILVGGINIMNLKVMTYNIAGGRNFGILPAKFNPEPAIEVIRSEMPDVCGLNEVDYKLPRSKEVKLAEYIGDALGYESYFARAVTWAPGDYGNGLVSKYHIISAETIAIPDPKNRTEKEYYEPRCVLHAKIAFPECDTDVFVTHFGLARTEKMKALSVLLSLLADINGPVILMGDFNLRPNDPFIDTLRIALEDTANICKGEIVTFPSRHDISADYKDQKIDYIFTSRNFTATSIKVPEFTASDHRPYIAELSYTGKENG